MKRSNSKNTVPDVEPKTDLPAQAKNHQAFASLALAPLEAGEEPPQVVVGAFHEAKVVDASWALKAGEQDEEDRAGKLASV